MITCENAPIPIGTEAASAGGFAAGARALTQQVVLR